MNMMEKTTLLRVSTLLTNWTNNQTFRHQS